MPNALPAASLTARTAPNAAACTGLPCSCFFLRFSANAFLRRSHALQPIRVPGKALVHRLRPSIRLVHVRRRPEQVPDNVPREAQADQPHVARLQQAQRESDLPLFLAGLGERDAQIVQGHGVASYASIRASIRASQAAPTPTAAATSSAPRAAAASDSAVAAASRGTLAVARAAISRRNRRWPGRKSRVRASTSLSIRSCWAACTASISATLSTALRSASRALASDIATCCAASRCTWASASSALAARRSPAAAPTL